jgi:nitrous oxidase accessory protein NosD
MITVQNLMLEGIPHELGNGNDTGKPVIESSQLNASYLFKINANYFSLLGCVLIGSPWLSSGIYVTAPHMVLSNNDISGGLSVYLDSCDYLQILNNTVTTSDNGSSSMFWIFYCDYALVQNNTLRNSLGIYVFYSRHCSILNNQVTNTIADAGIQVEDDEDVSTNDTISQNTVTNCSQTGISVNAVNISVMHNHVSDCQTGMVIDTGNSRIENNTIERCHFGLNLSCGLGDNNILTSNQVRNNSIGVILHQVGHKIIQVTRNNFIHNLVQVVVTAVVPVFSNYVFRENYWDHSLSHPKPVICLGLIIIWFPPLGLFIGIPLPWVCFDLTPAQHPYEIP